MEINALINTLETCGQTGIVLTTEESIVLHNSLVLLQNENHFRKIFFWGRIFGVENDYYIAYGYTSDVLMGRIYYYSTNCTDWGLLPPPTDNGKMLTPLCATKFQGDPALVVDVLIDAFEITIPAKRREPRIRQLKEDDRLASTVFYINQEAVVVPRGVFFKRPDGVVVENLSFEGLNDNEALETKTFLHFRVPENKWNTNLLTRNDYNYAIDFLDSADDDVPEGCFSLQVTPGGAYVIAKSIYWPGFVMYHRIRTPEYGYVYFGHGKKCLDVPFMMQPLE